VSLLPNAEEKAPGAKAPRAAPGVAASRLQISDVATVTKYSMSEIETRTHQSEASLRLVLIIMIGLALTAAWFGTALSAAKWLWLFL
jgi:hypothetical protein